MCMDIGNAIKDIRIKSLLSQADFAKELGVYEVVKRDGGWGNVSSQTCGNIVSKAIEIANRSVEK